MRPVVTFLSDFGLQDEFVGVCHGVIARTCPEAHVIHLTHGIPAQAVGVGSRILAAAIPYVPAGVHLAIVDPGVGSERRAVALRTADGRCFVGPDNGLLIPAAELCGGVVEAVHVTNQDYMLKPISPTFHGRDVFSPAAGHLASGVPLASLGDAVDLATLARPRAPAHRLEGTVLHSEIEHVDHFGNVRLGVSTAELNGLFRPGATVEIHGGHDRYFARCARTFAEVERGAFILHEDSSGYLSVAINRGSAGQLLTAAPGELLQVEFEPEPPGLEDAGWPA